MAQQSWRYQEIADELRQQIESGALPRESQLPTEVELQKKFGASRNTVRDAVKLLVLQRLLETRGREGTWVTKAHVPFVTTLSTDPKTGLVAAGNPKGQPTPHTYSNRAGKTLEPRHRSGGPRVPPTDRGTVADRARRVCCQQVPRALYR